MIHVMNSFKSLQQTLMEGLPCHILDELRVVDCGLLDWLTGSQQGRRGRFEETAVGTYVDDHNDKDVLTKGKVYQAALGRQGL